MCSIFLGRLGYTVRMRSYRYFMPTEIHFGAGISGALGEHCGGWGEKPLLVTGRGSARASGLLDRILGQFPHAEVFEDVPENPDTAVCERGAAACRAAQCDWVIGAGGGSAMDVAKAIALLARNPGACADYFSSQARARPALPIAAVPTTAGTGSEVTPYAVLVDAAARTKRTIRGHDLFPRAAFLDPEATTGMPPSITAATGLDALSQAMEGLLSKQSTAIGDALALEACRLITQWLPCAVRQGDDLDARGAMLHAAMLSGCIIAQSGTTLVHGMGYYFTLEFGLPHGLANALLLSPVFEVNARHEPEKVAAIAIALGHPAAPTPGEAAAAIRKALHGLLRQAGISPAARDAGVAESALDRFATDICNDPYRFKNQVGQFTVDDVRRLFYCAWSGEAVG